jgi:hypothetical protein
VRARHSGALAGLGPELIRLDATRDQLDRLIRFEAALLQDRAAIQQHLPVNQEGVGGNLRP